MVVELVRVSICLLFFICLDEDVFVFISIVCFVLFCLGICLIFFVHCLFVCVFVCFDVVLCGVFFRFFLWP